jgi:hypothetical protein
MPWVKLGQDSVTFNQAVTKGSRLRGAYDIGPWALQGAVKGSEVLQNMSVPGRGYWRFDAATEFTSDTVWPSNANDSNPSILNDPNLHEGKVTGSPVVIDGFTVPVGTYICQFRDFSATGDGFYAQGTSLPVLFRGCRWRFDSGVSGAGLFNDNGSSSSQHIYLHYCDWGLKSTEIGAHDAGIVHVKFLGGSNHRIHRSYSTLTCTAIQPNTQGCVITENWIDRLMFYYGESGESGLFDSSAYHINGCSSEGGITDLVFARNHVFVPSPDGATGSNGFTAAGQSGYGTQPGQTGYGSGTNPGRVISQTDCLALFNSNGLNNQGSAPGAIKVNDNFFAGGGYCVYAGQIDGAHPATNIEMNGNEFSTRFYTNGGANGAVAAQPPWGSNGNTQSGNVWYDDYGTGGNGSTALADRQYPAGDGPRVGTSVI